MVSFTPKKGSGVFFAHGGIEKDSRPLFRGSFEQIVERFARISRRNRTGFTLDRHTNAEQIALVVGVLRGYAHGHGLRTFKSRARIEVRALRAAMEIGAATFAAHVGYLRDVIAAPGTANDVAKPRHVRRSAVRCALPGVLTAPQASIYRARDGRYPGTPAGGIFGLTYSGLGFRDSGRRQAWLQSPSYPRLLYTRAHP